MNHESVLIAVLSRHIGARRGISVAELARAVYGPGAGPGDERRVRKMVAELRAQGEHICADPRHGYFIAETDEELDQTCRFLHDRAMTSLTQIAAMKRVSLPDLAGQLRIRMEDSNQ
jgi:hypothetical protein